MFRIIKAFQPRFIIGENVRGIVNIQDGVVFETVCTNLEDEGYEVQPFNIPAAAVGAPHRRERIWFIAVREEPMVDSDNIRFEQHSTTKETTSGRGTSATSQSTSNVGNSEYNGSPTSEIGRGNEKINGGTEKRQNGSVEFEGTSGSEDNAAMENSRRTLRSRGELQGENGNETREGNADQLKRSSSASEFNVADTNTRLGNGENEEIQSRGQTSDSSRTRGTTNVADTDTERLQGAEQFETHTGETKTQCSTTQSSKAAGNFWLVEPNVGRVAHGVSGRVHRLKGLGNSIVPQIVEEIGKAIIKAEQE
jgi:DNA (cytosine-5)-methyltransferase 1